MFTSTAQQRIAGQGHRADRSLTSQTPPQSRQPQVTATERRWINTTADAG